jgi:integrase/recombinase XerD
MSALTVIVGRMAGKTSHATRQSLEIYSRLALADAQKRYDDAIGDFPV